jgi:hypothetical protein
MAGSSFLDASGFFCGGGDGGGLGFDSCFGGSGFDSCFGGSGFFSGSGAFSSFGGAGFDSSFSSAGAFGSSFAGFFLSPDGSPPSSILTKSCPTVTVSSSLTKNSFIVPAEGALTATSIYNFVRRKFAVETRRHTLSVSIVAISSSCSTKSPTSVANISTSPCYTWRPELMIVRLLNCFSVPSLIDSAICGTLMVSSAVSVH